MLRNKRITFRKNRKTEWLEPQLMVRFLALIIDLIVIKMLISTVVYFSIGISPVSIAAVKGYYVIYISTNWLYFSGCEGILGATLGKMLMGLKVYDANGQKLGLLKAILRFPAKLLSVATVWGAIMLDTNKNKQALHDIICQTIVRKARESTSYRGTKIGIK
ncbi:hypothetical protein DN752_03665 [Echinicola strongylocentroti]|uniref:RDD domain-containing protein n=1 Tax=Echinicola strongylocentroti TaxID=1795355 RepID=A0A2Z4IF32_9BACT|nr:RDD family protein [Echinicola strongylocentroti]AWW29310.1 hypothetical protein DN752_03665 [Echinicola strongylocentroti]